MRLQRLCIALQGAAPREAEAWRSQWFESNGSHRVTKLLQWAEAVFPQLRDASPVMPEETRWVGAGWAARDGMAMHLPYPTQSHPTTPDHTLPTPTPLSLNQNYIQQIRSSP